MSRKGSSSASRSSKRLAKSAQSGAEDGANNAVYVIAFGLVASALYAVWAKLTDRGQ